VSSSLISVERVSFSYTEDVGDTAAPLALRDVSLAVHAGELLALIGRNGSGKTTLAKHLNGLLKPGAGRVLVTGHDIARTRVGELARTVGYAFQNPDHQLFLPSVRDELRYGPEQVGIAPCEIDERVEEALEHFGLADVVNKHPAVLGRGLRRLVVLAAIWTMRPCVYVLDEPTGGLDRRLSDVIMRLVAELAADGAGIVLITHEMRLVAEHAHRVALLNEGQLMATMPPRELFSQPALLAASGLAPPPIARLASTLESAGFPPRVSTVDDFVDAYRRLCRSADGS
jgi:energy-coupling factor transport system ATP-binding protein